MYDKISESEFEVHIPYCEDLLKTKCNFIEIKLNDKNSAKLQSNKFTPNQLEDEDSNTAVLEIPDSFKNGLRGHKLICTIIHTSKGMFGSSEKEVQNTEISLAGLTMSYETTSKIKFENAKFDVRIRVKQAYSGKEVEMQEV